MELPSLEEWSHKVINVYIPLASILSFLERSSCQLKVVKLSTLDSVWIDDFRMFLEAIPSLEHLSLEVSGYDDPATLNNVLDRLCDMSAITNAALFLPHLQTMNIVAQEVPFSWDRIPAIFRSSNRASLSMKFTFCLIHIEDMDAHQLLQLVDEGCNLRIIRKDVHGELDFIQELREHAVRSVVC